MDTLILITLCSVIIILLIVLLTKINKKKDNTSDFLNFERTQRESFDTFRSSLENRFDALDNRNSDANRNINRALDTLVSNNQKQMSDILNRNDKLLEKVSLSLEKIRIENSEQLDKMRQTVDEKLHETLETRLTQSFEQVIKQLESVHKGLGEMNNLAKGVGDLNKLFSNVKSRGVWGEVQVEAILSEILNDSQYERNFAPRKNSQARVEFAIKLPGKDDGEAVYLPIDSKFPKEDYEKFIAASDQGDADGMKDARASIRKRIISEAIDIRDKYIHPPRTTNFAIMFLPTESLYAEVLRMDGLAEEIQAKHKVSIAGPTTLAALINSLQMGFQTLAIEKRSKEVWSLFADMQKNFGYFAKDLEIAQRSFETASKRLENVQDRTKKITRKIENIKLPEGINASQEAIEVEDSLFIE